MTKHCCQVCILSVVFVALTAGCVMACGKWLCNKQGTPHRTMWFDFTPTGRGIWEIFFTFNFHILPQQRHRCWKYSQSLYFIKRLSVLTHLPGNHNHLLNCWTMVERSKMTFISIYILLQTRTNIMTMTFLFYTRFLSPTDQKCESSKFRQISYYRQPGKFRYTAGEIFKMSCKELDTYIYI